MIKSPEQVCNIVEHLRGERGTWDSHWQEISDFIIPRKNDFNNFKSPGQKRNVQLLDNTGMHSCELLAGALHSMLTNPAIEFFELSTGDANLDSIASVRAWLQDCTTKIHNKLNDSNFQTEAHEFYLDLCGFNTAGLTVLEDELMDVVFQAYFLKELYIMENNKGLVDEIYRFYTWTAKQIVQEFGLKNVPKCVQEVFESGKEERFELIHATYPCDEYGAKRKNFKFKYASQYIFVKEKTELRLKGFNENPWLVARWAKASGEQYGRGPGMNALPEVKMVNAMEEAVIKGAQKTIDPPLQAPDDGFVLPIKTRPASVNFYRSGGNGKDRIEPIFNDARIDFGIEIMEAHRSRIRQTFYIDKLQLIQQDRMTAEEVRQRRDDDMRFLGPLLARLQVEFLGPLVERTFNIMQRRGRFLAAPPELNKKQITVRYSSAIAKVQRMSEVRNFMEFMSVTAPLTQIDPAVIDNLNPDNAYLGVAQMYSIKQKFLNDPDQVEEIRAAKAKAQKAALDKQNQTHEADLINKAVPALAKAQDTINASEGV